MTKKHYMIQMTDAEAAKMLQTMAREDLRSYGNEVAYLIRQEVERRSSTWILHNPATNPVINPVITTDKPLDNYRKETE